MRSYLFEAIVFSHPGLCTTHSINARAAPLFVGIFAGCRRCLTQAHACDTPGRLAFSAVRIPLRGYLKPFQAALWFVVDF